MFFPTPEGYASSLLIVMFSFVSFDATRGENMIKFFLFHMHPFFGIYFRHDPCQQKNAANALNIFPRSFGFKPKNLRRLSTRCTRFTPLTEPMHPASSLLHISPFPSFLSHIGGYHWAALRHTTQTTERHRWLLEAIVSFIKLTSSHQFQVLFFQCILISFLNFSFIPLSPSS